MGGSDAGPSVLHWLVRDAELAQVVADHLRLDLHLVEALSVVDAHDGSGHLGDDDHVAQVGLDDVGLLVGRALLLLLAQLLDQGHRLPLQAAGELAPEEYCRDKLSMQLLLLEEMHNRTDRLRGLC